MRLNLRNILRTTIVLLALAAVIIPPELSVVALVCCALLAAGLSVFLFCDWLLGKWLRRQINKPVTPLFFLLGQGGWILFFSGLCVAALAALFSYRLNTDIEIELLNTSLIALGVGAVGLVVVIIGKIPHRKKGPHAEVIDRLPEWPLEVQMSEARDFNSVPGPRATMPLVRLLLASITLITVIGFVFGSLIWLVSFYLDHAIPVVDFEAWPLAIKVLVMVGAALISHVAGTGLLAAFRIVDVVRRTGHVRQWEAFRQFGLAAETAGFFGTAGWGMMVLSGLGIITFGSLWIHQELVTSNVLPVVGAAIVSTFVGLVSAWILILWPQLYILPIMTSRDCGWLKASEAATTILSIEGRQSFKKALRATLWVFSVWRSPGAFFLLLKTTDYYELVISIVLQEKTEVQINQSLEEYNATRPAALKKAWKALDDGRYLDALNAFQMHQRNHRENLDSLRGETLALLYIGNPKSRESLERWERLAPEDPEPKRLLEELNAGLWREGGEAYETAQRRSTQEIGRGV